jgi:prevent-host-death family protein
MTTTTYSIAEARNHFAALIHQVETGTEPVRVTRRGEPVAIILSLEVYEQLAVPPAKPDYLEAYNRYQALWQDELMDIEEDIWADVRDKDTGRELNLWDE